MGQIADRIAEMIRAGAKGREIIATIEVMESWATLPTAPTDALDVGPTDFEDWWQRWPNKVAKKDAQKAYRAARRRGHSSASLLQWASAYIEQKPTDRPWMNAATFLNGERWKDQPAPVAAKPLRGLAAAKEQLRQEIENDRQPRQARSDPHDARGVSLWSVHGGNANGLR